MMQNALNILEVLYDADFWKPKTYFSPNFSHASYTSDDRSIVQLIFYPIPNIH